MKIAILLLFSFYFSSISAQQELPTKDGKVYYELIDSSVGESSQLLYNKSKMWFAETFNDSKEVIQLDDKENNTIIGKGLFKFDQGFASYNCRFTVKIMCKDGKYRAQFYDTYLEAGTSRSVQSVEDLNERKAGGKVKVKINEGFESMIRMLKTYMKKPVDNKF